MVDIKKMVNHMAGVDELVIVPKSCLERDLADIHDRSIKLNETRRIHMTLDNV